MRRDTRGMARRLIAGHSPFEAVAGFSRAVVSGGLVHVAGTAPIPRDGSPTPPDAFAQARVCLALIAEALDRAGSSLDDVVRTRMYLTDAADWPDVARAHGEAFADVRPAATAVVVAGLLDPSWKVEIEADAVVPEGVGLKPDPHAV
jgi:enamine deaminase RidA (YjgF/YER057c/UK114 family)